MADISRLASPMSLCEEDLFDVDKSVEKKKKELTALQKQTASFVIGSVDVINERISNLTSQLSLYDSKLAIDSQSSYNNEIIASTKRKTPYRSTRSARAREERDAEMFEGALSQEEVVSSPEKSFKKRLFAKKSDEPQMVELQQYPGFDPMNLNPLPHSLETETVLDRVVSAQVDLARKPSYRQYFVNILYSRSQKAIMQDTFWWFFLNRFHPDPDVQSKLFKRIAKKFIILYLSPLNLRYKNVFLMSYGNILAQSVYCAFCLAFPQSWRQFDEHEFKEILLGTCVLWVSGIRPRPGLYDEWNYAALEPSGMRKDESINHDNDDTNQMPFASVTMSEKLSPSLSRDSAVKSKTDSKSKLSANRSEVLSGMSQKTKLNDVTENRPSESCTAGKAVEFEKCVFNLYGGSPLLHEYLQERNFVPKTGVDHLVSRTQVVGCREKLTNSVETMNSFLLTLELNTLFPYIARVSKKMALIDTMKNKEKMGSLVPDVRYVEIRSYVPSSAKTYQDIIDESTVEVKRIAGEFQKLNSEFVKDTQTFSSKQKVEENEYATKSKKILSKPNKVRRLSALILMDMKFDSNLEVYLKRLCCFRNEDNIKKDQNEKDNTKVGVSVALNAALAAEPAE